MSSYEMMRKINDRQAREEARREAAFAKTDEERIFRGDVDHIEYSATDNETIDFEDYEECQGYILVLKTGEKINSDHVVYDNDHEDREEYDDYMLSL